MLGVGVVVAGGYFLINAYLSFTSSTTLKRFAKWLRNFWDGALRQMKTAEIEFSCSLKYPNCGFKIDWNEF